MNNQTNREASQNESPVSHVSANPVGQLCKSLPALVLKLASSGWGRVALHLIVAIKTGHYVWHLQGIAREIIRH